MEGQPRQAPPERAGATIRLLWRHAIAGPAGRARRSGLTVDAVVDAAIALADAEGLDALTMRRVADELGVSAMTPYGYVPGKSELLELMVDAVSARMSVRPPRDGGWRARVTAVADDNRTLHRTHPWTLALPTGRPPLGPGLLGKYERELAPFDGIGLDDIEMDAALSHLLGLVRQSVHDERQAAEAQAASGTDDAGWWDTVGPLLAQVVDETEYPLASRVGTAAGTAHGSAYDPDHVYAFGLARFLDGIDALVRLRAS